MTMKATVLCDEEFLPAAIDLISSAQKRIYISTFKAEITTRPRGRVLNLFFEKLFLKAASGLDVRFLINQFTGTKSIPFTNTFAVRELKKRKVDVRCLRNSRICHAKIIIVDYTAAILGSHNLSVRACHNNFETSLYFEHTGQIERLTAKYIETFNSAQKI